MNGAVRRIDPQEVIELAFDHPGDVAVDRGDLPDVAVDRDPRQPSHERWHDDPASRWFRCQLASVAERGQ